MVFDGSLRILPKHRPRSIDEAIVLPLDSSNDEAYSLLHDTISPKSSCRKDRRTSTRWRYGHVVVRVGENLIESVITKRSADEMKLKWETLFRP